jgi:Icc protein
MRSETVVELSPSGTSTYRRLLHLSDPHLTTSGIDKDGVNASVSLRQMLNDVGHLLPVDAVIVSGDITDDGSIGGYRQALDLVTGFAMEHGIPSVFSAGNHDQRQNFIEVLGSGHRGADGSDNGTAMPSTDERAAFSDLNGLRVITVDSLVPGHAHGHVSKEQLAWLRNVLATLANSRTVLVLHHPPISVPRHPMRKMMLDNPDDLADVIAGTDVCAVISGHLHHQLAGSLAGIPVWVTPGIVTRIDTASPSTLIRGVLGAAATIIDLVDGSPIFRIVQARDPRSGEQVYLCDALSGEAVESEDITFEGAP